MSIVYFLVYLLTGVYGSLSPIVSVSTDIPDSVMMSSVGLKLDSVVNRANCSYGNIMGGSVVICVGDNIYYYSEKILVAYEEDYIRASARLKFSSNWR